ncbi:MAG: sulfurtransferase-like selenium metabolism protein YedF [Desulfohalobiaceae bacterium]|nr:sulfurtransferase-like selenium metabolism protein YedF [Desulfohalobiaceae bacterium]
MSPAELDCTGLACPQPVMRCKDLLQKEKPAGLRVVVDNQPARDNVSRFLKSQGYALEEVAEKEGAFLITARRSSEGVGVGPRDSGTGPEPEEVCAVPEPNGRSGGQLVFITSDGIGRGDEELGSKLMKNFIRTLPEMGGLWRIILINAGVRLAVKDSGLLPELQNLEASGVSILVCGTCLEHLQLLEEKAIGETTNMLDVVTSLQLAGKVITI